MPRPDSPEPYRLAANSGVTLGERMGANTETDTESKKKPNRAFRHAVEYHAARFVVFMVSLLPLPLASWLGRRLGDFVRLIDRNHRTRAEEQVTEILGLDKAAAAGFVKANFRNYGLIFAEFARLRRMRREDFPQYVVLGDFMETADGLRAEGKGLIFITAHFGNWEWCNSLATSLNFQGGSFARPLDNPRLNAYVNRIRERNGMTILEKRRAIRTALDTLKNNGVIGILVDQDAGWQGLMSPFLGKPASTITLPAELAMRTGSPLVVVLLQRTPAGDRRFVLRHGSLVHRFDPDADPKDETARLTNALNEELSSMIKDAPEQWFWIHRRWKSYGKKGRGWK